MRLARRDAHFGPETIAEAIGEARRGVDEGPRAVEATTEYTPVGVGFGHDGVGMVRGMSGDVSKGGGERGDNGDCYSEVEKLGIVVFWC